MIPVMFMRFLPLIAKTGALTMQRIMRHSTWTPQPVAFDDDTAALCPSGELHLSPRSRKYLVRSFLPLAHSHPVPSQRSSVLGSDSSRLDQPTDPRNLASTLLRSHPAPPPPPPLPPSPPGSRLPRSMPKKHQPTYLSIKPSSTASSSRAPATPPPAAAQSVNERIQQLRREQAPRASAQRRDEVTEVVSRRTVPPHLRRLLHMAEVDAPPPKPGTRARAAPLRPGQRPPPGPAPPSSWLQGSQHASQRNVRRKTSGVGRARMCMLARVHDEEFKVRTQKDPVERKGDRVERDD